MRGHLEWVHGMHKHAKFDELSGGGARDPSQRIGMSVLERLSSVLKSDAIRRVTTYMDKVIAHAERLSQPIELPTYAEASASRVAFRYLIILCSRSSLCCSGEPFTVARQPSAPCWQVRRA